MPSSGHFQIAEFQMAGLRQVDVELMAARMRADNPTQFDNMANHDPIELGEMVTRQVRQQNLARQAEEEEAQRDRQQRPRPTAPAPPPKSNPSAPVPCSMPTPCLNTSQAADPWGDYQNPDASSSGGPMYTDDQVQESAFVEMAGAPSDPQAFKECVKFNYKVRNVGKIQQMPRPTFLCVYCQDAECQHCGVTQKGKHGGVS